MADDRTEKATPQKRKKARREGQIGNSHELGSWVTLMVASFVIPHTAKALMTTATESVEQVQSIIAHPETGPAIAIAQTAGRGALMAALPLGLLAMVMGVASVAAQGSLGFTPKLLKPKFSRLNPLSGIKRMFGKQVAVNLGKALAKTAALALVCYFALRPLLPTLTSAGALPLSASVKLATSSVIRLVRWSAGAGLALAVVDAVMVRRRNSKQLKMTKQEVKDELRNNEGDPHVRGQRRARQMAMRRNRMMAEVANADVVVVNPTHVAVALKYDPARGAPRVVAKGADHVAARIRALAEENRVPMVADIPLARTLHANCRLGEEISPELYHAVAVVLAFVMGLARRGSSAGVHTVRTLAPLTPRTA